jgi:hypothetical protein
MKSEILMDYIGHINDKLIVEADVAMKKNKSVKRRPWVKWASIAAVFAVFLLVSIPFIINHVQHTDPADPNGGIVTDPNVGVGGEYEHGAFRPIYYDLPAPFADLVGRDAYHEWHGARSEYERNNICVAVGFVQHFNISKGDFTAANEELLRIWTNIGVSPDESSMYELYPVDLIFTFDNKAINEFFLWENSPIESERNMGITDNN